MGLAVAKCLSWAALCALVVPSCVVASEVQWHGFVSEALVYADHHRMGYAKPNQLGSYLSEGGLNVSAQIDGHWLLSAQVLSRWDGIQVGKPRWDVLMAERMLLNQNGQQLAVQAGMLKNPYGFYNTTRDVAHTRPGIVLPWVYHDQARNFVLSAPAMAVRGRHTATWGNLSWQLNVLQPDVNNPTMVMFLVGAQQGGQMQPRRSAVGQVLWESERADWRLAWSFTDMGMHYRPVPTDFRGAGAFSGAGDLSLRSHLLSLEHNTEHWTHTVEYAQARILRDNFNIPGVPFMDRHSTLEQGYVQMAYRFTPNWQTWLRRDWMFVDNQDRNGLAFAALTGQSPYQRYMRDMSWGVRCDPTPNWSLMAEVHHINGAANLALFNNPPATQRPRWNMFLLQADYHF